jgi:hypothetical protein
MSSFPRRSSRHGAEIPALGLGTGGLGQDCAQVVAAALAAGYRHDEMKRIAALKRPNGRVVNPVARVSAWDV